MMSLSTLKSDPNVEDQGKQTRNKGAETHLHYRTIEWKDTLQHEIRIC
jgi:hypothetical protein